MTGHAPQAPPLFGLSPLPGSVFWCGCERGWWHANFCRTIGFSVGRRGQKNSATNENKNSMGHRWRSCLVCVYVSFNGIIRVLPEKTPVVGEKMLGQTTKETENPYLVPDRPNEDLRVCAEQGDVKAQLNLGVMYFFGEGVVGTARKR